MHTPRFKVGDGVYNHPPPQVSVTKKQSLLEIETFGFCRYITPTSTNKILKEITLLECENAIKKKKKKQTVVYSAKPQAIYDFETKYLKYRQNIEGNDSFRM